MRKIIEVLKGGRAIVQCECGSIRTVCLYYIRKCPDARCQKCSNPINARQKPAPHRGIGDISCKLYGYYQHTAKRRNLVFDVGIQELWDLFLKQNKRCVFTNIELKFVSRTRNNCINHLAMTASLDRIDSKKGYVRGNIQWVHKRINRLKWNLSDEEFIYWCRLVADANPELSSVNDIEVAETAQRLTGEESIQ